MHFPLHEVVITTMADRDALTPGGVTRVSYDLGDLTMKLRRALSAAAGAAALILLPGLPAYADQGDLPPSGNATSSALAE